jgi:2-polyprenyl-3-methyl-5-hydroxy-6-metoxy-1,4-benzoquinol methylase
MTAAFYTSIAPHYQHIFPFNPDQIEFLRQVLPYNGARVLDVGCAAGDLAFALTHFGFPTWAIDFDPFMIQIAQNTKPEDTMFPVFEQLDMRTIAERYPESYFDAVICFGNTLVHLLSDEDILQFFKATLQVLAPKGKFTFQILNYDNILRNQISGLPVIENEHVRFERKYVFPENSGLISFRTKLMVKQSGQEIENIVDLNPIGSKKIVELLSKAGFSNIQLFGSFKREPLTEKSIPLVVSCARQ